MITTFTFDAFYCQLSDRGMIIYPGNQSGRLFRIGSIGRIFVSDVQALVGAIGATLNDLHISL